MRLRSAQPAYTPLDAWPHAGTDYFIERGPAEGRAGRRPSPRPPHARQNPVQLWALTSRRALKSARPDTACSTVDRSCRRLSAASLRSASMPLAAANGGHEGGERAGNHSAIGLELSVREAHRRPPNLHARP